jgi:hypothetical protein
MQEIFEFSHRQKLETSIDKLRDILNEICCKIDEREVEKLCISQQLDILIVEYMGLEKIKEDIEERGYKMVAMLDRINEEIKLCFSSVTSEVKIGAIAKDTTNYKVAAALIASYNRIVKLYYPEVYVQKYSKGNVTNEFKYYCENGL